MTNNNVENFYKSNPSLVSVSRTNSFASQQGGVSETADSSKGGIDIESHLHHHSFSLKDKKAENHLHDIGNVVITFPLPSKDPIIEHKKVYDLSRSLRLGDTVSSLSKIADIAEENGVSGETILKLNNTFIWLEKDDIRRSSAMNNNSNSNSNKNNNNNNNNSNNNDNDENFHSFNYSGNMTVAGLIIPRTGCEVLLHIKSNEDDIGECVVNLIDLITTDTNLTTRSVTVKHVPLTDGSRLVGHLTGHFSLKFLAEVQVNEKRN